MAHKDRDDEEDILPHELDGIMRGLRDVAEGKTKSFDEIQSELATKYNRLN